MAIAHASDDLSKICFPVLRVSDTHIRRFRSITELRRMTQEFLAAGQAFRGALLFDVEGNKFEVVNVVRRRRSWHFAYWFARSPAFIVDVSIGPPAKTSLSELKTSFCDLVVKNRWYEEDDVSEAEFKQLVMRSASFVELFDRISFFGKWVG